jgi:predicted flap endonuclease-1-like 5' DNA nuclease
LHTEVERYRSTAEQVQQENQRHTATISDLQTRLAAAQQAAADTAGLREQLADRDRELTQARSHVEQVRAASDEHARRGTALEAEVARDRATIVDLRRRLDAAPPANPRPQSPVGGGVVAETASAPPAALVASPAVPTDSKESGAGSEPDDLKLIFGIGPKLARMLNEKGILHFRQIARWTAADVSHWDDELPEFRGRIERDNWIQGAQDEHLKKYGERA